MALLPYLDRLKQGLLLFDGGMATLLFSRGVYLKKCFEETCLSSPQMVLDAHNDYLAAGAQALETNTYGANPFKLASFGLADKTEKINQAAVRLARQAAGDQAYVAGCIGPSGRKFGAPTTFGVEALREGYRRQIGALLWAGVDLLLFETFADRNELDVALTLAREMAPTTPIQAQFTIDRMVSVSDEDLRGEAAAWGRWFQDHPAVDVAGMNLMGPADVLEALQVLKPLLKKPLAVQPDAGFPKNVDGRHFFLTTPDYFAEYAKLFVDMGVNVLGGCCGTTPEHIGQMAKAVLAFDRGRRGPAVEVKVDAPARPETPLTERSSFGADLAAGRWVSTVELVAPLGWDLAPLLAKAEALKAGGVRYFNIPDGPRASARLGALTTAVEIQRRTGCETILHVATRDKNLIGLQGDLFGAYYQGLRNVLLITGDPPKVGKYPNVTGVFDVDSIGLTDMVRRLNQGLDMAGEALPAPTGFVRGAGVNPAFPSPDQELDRAFRKVEAGAEFFITQPVWDQDQLDRFLRRLEPAGVPVILGVWPLASYRNAVFLNNEVPGVSIPDPVMERMRAVEDKELARREGVALAREILGNFRSRIQGVQVSPPFHNVQTALEVLEGW